MGPSVLSSLRGDPGEQGDRLQLVFIREIALPEILSALWRGGSFGRSVQV